MMRWQWYQLDRMQIICTSLQTDRMTDNHACASPLSFYTPDALHAAQPIASKHGWQNYRNCKFYEFWEHKYPIMVVSLKRLLRNFRICGIFYDAFMFSVRPVCSTVTEVMGAYLGGYVPSKIIKGPYTDETVDWIRKI